MVILFGGLSRRFVMGGSGLNMSRRIRRTPFTDKVESYGVTGFTVVNHMLLPKSFKKSVEEDYWHLKENVQIWDVSCQRQVEILGPDAEKLVQIMTPRTIGNMNIGQCLYIPLLDENAGIINDPILLKLEKNRFWLSIADSDVLLWTKGLAFGLNLNVKILEPEIFPLAIQGPKAEDLMANIFGESIRSINFFNFKYFDFLGTQQLVARSGYSKQGGFEIYFNGFNLGSQLWDLIWDNGKKFNISAGCPNLIERIEGGLLSYGNEFTIENNPFECNFDKFFNLDSDHNFIGKESLKKIKKAGINKKIKGVLFDGGPCPTCSKPFPVFSKKGKKIGQITSAIYNPRLEKNTGLSMIDNDFWNDGHLLDIKTFDNISREGMVSSIPFN